MLNAINDADYSVGTDASYGADHSCMAAFLVQRHNDFIHEVAHPCAANSSFDGKLTAILDAIEYIMQHLLGSVLIITEHYKKHLTYLCIQAFHRVYKSLKS